MHSLLSKIRKCHKYTEDCLANLFDWRTTRPVEASLSLINLAWIFQVNLFGQAFNSIVPQSWFSYILIIALFLTIFGLLLDSFRARTWGLFLGSMSWIFNIIVTYEAGNVTLVYPVLFTLHSWAYLTLVRYTPNIPGEKSG